MLQERSPAASVMDFGGRPIGYDKQVLKPRPWTQAQSLWARELLATVPPGPVLELFAGAGQIGLLAVAESCRILVQVDADLHACTWAWRNARTWGVTADVRHGDVTEALEPHERFALVIADPPWVPTARVADFPEDPVVAIDGGADGLTVARGCLAVMARHLMRDGFGLIQVRGLDQVRRLRADAASCGLTIVDARQFDGGAVALLRRAGEAPQLSPREMS